MHLAGGEHTEEPLPIFANTKKLITKALKRIFSKNLPSPTRRGVRGEVQEVDPDLWKLTYQVLDKAITQGTGSVQYNKPNFALTKQLRDSAALFSAQKSWAQAKELAAIAASKDGYQLTWKEFLEKAKPVVGNYNKRWLKTEYNTAIRAARQASLWTKYEDTADLYPNLKYMPSRAATPREEHKPYYGIVRPLDDDFWVQHLPPSAWNCICGVEQTDEDVTPIPVGPAAVAGLNNNPGLTGKLFSSSHPYAVAAPNLTRQAYQLLAESDNYYEIITSKGNKIKVHPTYTKDDLTDNINTAINLADNGYQVELPRHTFKPGVSNPDFIIDGILADLKEPGSNPKKLPTNIANSISSAIKSANKQKVGIVVISIHNSQVHFTRRNLFEGILRATHMGGIPINKNINRILLIGRDGKITSITRKELEENLLTEKLRSVKT